MPIWIALGGVLLNIAASLAGRVLIALGMSFVTYTGFTVAIDFLLNSIKSNIGAMPSEVVSFLAWLWVDKAIGMIFSAFAAAMVIKMAGGTKLTKLVTKG